jgi:Tfp pilus assembly protein PilO
MTPTPVDRLARLPPRQLDLLLGGAIAVVLALLWTFGVRAPLAAMRIQQTERSRLEFGAGDPARAAQQLAVLAAQVATLERALGQAGTRGRDEIQLRLISEVDRAARRRQVHLRSAAPGAARNLASFVELPIEVEAAGAYPALVEWMADIERLPVAPAIVSFDIRPGEAGRPRIIKIRMAAYLAAGDQP